MRIRPPLTAVLGVALLAAGPAAAEEPPSFYARNGVYLAAQAIVGIELFDMDTLESRNNNRSLNADNFYSVSGRMGYRFHPHVAAEVQGDWIRDADMESVAKYEGATFTANVKAYALTERIQPFVYAGVGGGFLSIDNKSAGTDVNRNVGGFVARFGTGFDFYFNEDVGFTGDVNYLLPTGEMQDYSYLGVNLGFFIRF